MPYQVPSGPLSWDDSLRLFPGVPVEIIDGVAIARDAPLNPHQRIVTRLISTLVNYLDAHPGVGEAICAPFDVKLRSEAPAIVVEPDVLVVLEANRHRIVGCLEGPPDIAVEVVSASSRQRDAIRKRAIYARYGVPEYWIIWPEERQVDVLRLAGTLYEEVASLVFGDELTSPMLPGFSIAVDKLFPANYGT